MPFDQLTVRTLNNVWVIPHDCELLKALLSVRGIRAHDLRFKSPQQCQRFIRQVALLAASDELQNASPSCLASLTQELVRRNTNHNPSLTATL